MTSLPRSCSVGTAWISFLWQISRSHHLAWSECSRPWTPHNSGQCGKAHDNSDNNASCMWGSWARYHPPQRQKQTGSRLLGTKRYLFTHLQQDWRSSSNTFQASQMARVLGDQRSWQLACTPRQGMLEGTCSHWSRFWSIHTGSHHGIHAHTAEGDILESPGSSLHLPFSSFQLPLSLEFPWWSPPSVWHRWVGLLPAHLQWRQDLEPLLVNQEQSSQDEHREAQSS